MCLIAHVTEGHTIPFGALERSFKTNDDGAGVMFPTKDGRVHVHRIMPKKWKDVQEMLESYEDKEVGIHLRFKTVGNIDRSNVHPYAVMTHKEDGRDVYIMHNGTISNVPTLGDKERSDSFHFATKVLRPVLIQNPDLLHAEEFHKWLGDVVGNSRLLILDGPTGKFIRVNGKSAGAREENGIWFSNGSGFYSTTPAYTYSRGSAGYTNYSAGANRQSSGVATGGTQTGNAGSSSGGSTANNAGGTANNGVGNASDVIDLKGLNSFDADKFLGREGVPGDRESFWHWWTVDVLGRDKPVIRIPAAGSRLSLDPAAQTDPAGIGLYVMNPLKGISKRRQFKYFDHTNHQYIYVEHITKQHTGVTAERTIYAPLSKAGLTYESDDSDLDVLFGIGSEQEDAEIEELVKEMESENKDNPTTPGTVIDGTMIIGLTREELYTIVVRNPDGIADYLFDMLSEVAELREPDQAAAKEVAGNA